MANGIGQGYAVIFDMDGVLVDSYDAHFKSWQALFEAHGKQITDEEFKATFGLVARDVMARWFGPGKFTDAEIKQIDHDKEAAYREIIKQDFPAMEGAQQLIAALHDAGFKLAVGSSGPPENIELTLDRLEARSRVSAVVTGRDVQRGKPDPQVFQLAAEKLGVPPGKCAVVEDAPMGVQAANSAGILSIGLVNRVGHTAESLAQAKHRVTSLRELSPEKIKAWIDGQ